MGAFKREMERASGGRFAGNEQQDAHEFLGDLVNAIHDDLAPFARDVAEAVGLVQPDTATTATDEAVDGGASAKGQGSDEGGGGDTATTTSSNGKSDNKSGAQSAMATEEGHDEDSDSNSGSDSSNCSDSNGAAAAAAQTFSGACREVATWWDTEAAKEEVESKGELIEGAFNRSKSKGFADDGDAMFVTTEMMKGGRIIKLLQQWMDGTLLGGSMDSVSNHVLISSFVVPNIALLLFIFAKLDLVDSGKVEDPRADYILDDPSSWMEVLPRPPKKRSRKRKGSTEAQEGEDTAEDPSGSYAVSYPGEGGSAAPATDGDAEVVRRTGAGLAVEQ